MAAAEQSALQDFVNAAARSAVKQALRYALQSDDELTRPEIQIVEELVVEAIKQQHADLIAGAKFVAPCRLAEVAEARLKRFIELVARGSVDRAMRTMDWRVVRVPDGMREDITDLFVRAIRREAKRVQEAADHRPAVIDAAIQGRVIRKEVRRDLAGELKRARSSLKTLSDRVAVAEVEAENAFQARRKSVEAEFNAQVKSRRKALADDLRQTRAKLLELREAKATLEENVDREKKALWSKAINHAVSTDELDRRAAQYPAVPAAFLVASSTGEGLPPASGIYFLWSGNRIIYVGKSICLTNRVRAPGHHILRPGFGVSFVLIPASDLDWAENYYIGLVRPEANYGGRANWRMAQSQAA